MRGKALIALGVAVTCCGAAPTGVAAKATGYVATIDVRPAGPGQDSSDIVGYVFEDLNRDGRRQGDSERGIPGVLVSDGYRVVQTDEEGLYRLPAPSPEDETAGIAIFITKPAGYDVPVDENNIPQFAYIHKPAGSPPNVRGEGFRFGGLAPTGPLPSQINFPLIAGDDKGNFKESPFKIVVSGDTQTYSNNEIGYLRDTLVREVAAMQEELEALIIEGDVMGDDLSLFPRFKQTVRAAGIPQYYVPGNHDLDFDAPGDAHSYDTFQREWGPAYYSFDIGHVHFVVLDDVRYPCEPDPDNLDGRHDFCNNPQTSPTYNGVITPRQMAWLRNDLAHVPPDKLIVLNMHIPIQTFIDSNSTQHQVDNALELYDLLGYGPSGNPVRPALALSGHTHTVENLRPGELFAGWATALGERSPGAIPFPQIVVGAACGAWWAGDFDANGVPESWDRLGGPRGYYIIEFTGNTYRDTFKATGKPIGQQMSVDFLTPPFEAWAQQLMDWAETDPAADAAPPVNINDLPDTKMIPRNELASTKLSVNVWNGSRDSLVYVQYDDSGITMPMQRTQAGYGEDILQTLDPYALKRQLQVARHAFISDSGNPRAQGFEQFRGNVQGNSPSTPRPGSSQAVLSPHVWQAPLPGNLAIGSHVAKVVSIDIHGQQFTEHVVFEVVESRLDQERDVFFHREFFEALP
jgi:hypothetical protein